jgi:hypothetical protein
LTATDGVLPPPADQIGGKGVALATKGSGAGDSPVTNEFAHSVGPAEAPLASEGPVAAVVASREGATKANNSSAIEGVKSEALIPPSETSAKDTENSVAKDEAATVVVAPAKADDGIAAGLAKSDNPLRESQESVAKSEPPSAVVESRQDSKADVASAAAPGATQTNSARGEGTNAAFSSASAAPDPGDAVSKAEQMQSGTGAAVANADPAADLPSKASERRITLAPEVRDELLNVGRRVVSFAFPIEIGERVPEDINIGVVPALVVERVPALSGQFFFVVGDRVVVADPRTRQIVEIIGPNG